MRPGMSKRTLMVLASINAVAGALNLADGQFASGGIFFAIAAGFLFLSRTDRWRTR